jgi:hypothetical protein
VQASSSAIEKLQQQIQQSEQIGCSFIFSFFWFFLEQREASELTAEVAQSNRSAVESYEVYERVQAANAQLLVSHGDLKMDIETVQNTLKESQTQLDSQMLQFDSKTRSILEALKLLRDTLTAGAVLDIPEAKSLLLLDEINTLRKQHSAQLLHVRPVDPEAPVMEEYWQFLSKTWLPTLLEKLKESPDYQPPQQLGAEL